MRRRACHALMMTTATFLVAFVAALVGHGRVSAQTPVPATVQDTIYRVRLLDGSTLYGRLENRTDTTFTLVTSNGVRVPIMQSQIREMAPAAGRIIAGEYWAPDPNPSRLFFAPTARSIGHGSGYVGVFMIGLPFVAVGVTDRITLAAGAPVLFGVVDPFYIAPKIELISTSKFSVAAGVLSLITLRDITDDDWETIGIVYGVTTVGTADQALTVGFGYGYAGDEISGQPAIMIGGETRASRRIKLISENYFVAGETGAILSGGIRYVGDRFTSDVGVLGAVAGGESFCCIPLVNFSYTFGQRRQ